MHYQSYVLIFFYFFQSTSGEAPPFYINQKDESLAVELLDLGKSVHVFENLPKGKTILFNHTFSLESGSLAVAITPLLM